MLNKYVEANARGFIHQSETVLSDDYPVHYGYCYVAVYEDGEAKVVSSDVRGTVADLRRDLASLRKDKAVAEIRRCDIVARQLDAI